jgi:AcrR family transcriptional regulator
MRQSSGCSSSTPLVAATVDRCVFGCSGGSSAVELAVAKTIITIIIIISIDGKATMPFDSPDLNFPGVMPSRQKRSRETTAALLRAGADMLRTYRLEELSIEALCAEINVTVGAFYSRFESKDAYFNALLGLAARDGNAMQSRMMQDNRLADLPLDALCDTLVRHTIEWMRAHEGIMRAALQRGDAPESKWGTFKELARTGVIAATPVLLRAMGPGRQAAKARTIGFGFQVILGTLVNAILNNPGPLSVHDKEMSKRLSQCFRLLLETEMKAPAVKSTAARTGKRPKDQRKTTVQ